MIANVTILLASSLCLFYLGLNAYALLRADSLIFPAPPSSYDPGEITLRLPAGDGETIAAYLLSSPGAERLLIYSHGNGEDIGMARGFLNTFAERGISVLAYDYPGYGVSSGQPSERGCYAAIEAAYKHATKELGFEPQNIILYGRSLGSGPSTWLAERSPVGGLILDGAFTSTFRVMTGVKLLPWDKFDNLARLPQLDLPILLIHGKEDRVVPFSHARKNWAALTGPKKKLFVAGAGHNNVVEVAGPLYWDTVLAFIQSPRP